MATNAVDVNAVSPEQPSGINELPIVEEKRTYSRVGFTKTVETKEGPKEEYSAKVMAEDDAKKAVEDFNKAKAEGKSEFTNVEIEVTQTFGFDHAHTIEAAVEIFGEEDAKAGNKELLKQLNNAVDVKLGNRVRSLLLATNDTGDAYAFEPAEGTYSLRSYIGEATAARGKTDFEKAKNIFGKLPQAQREALLALYMAEMAKQ